MATRSRPPLKPAPLLIKGPGTLPSVSRPCRAWGSIPQARHTPPPWPPWPSERLEQEVGEIKEAGIETAPTSLQLQGPRTPEDTKPPAVEATPHPLSKVDPIGLTSWVLFWPNHPKDSPPLPNPLLYKQCPASAISPPSPHLQSPIGTAAPPPPAPVAAYPAPVKVDHPDAYTGKIGSEAKQWLTRMLAWTWLNARMFPTDQEVLSFLLMNMKDTAGAWAHPHLNQLGSHQAIIQTQTIQPHKGTSTGQATTGLKKLSNNPNFVLEEERNRRRAAGACIKCGKMGHKFAECRTGWKATLIEDKGKAKEAAKIGKDSKYQSGKERNLLIYAPRTAESLRLPLIDLPSPCTVTMLDGSSPQAGKIWKKASLTFSLDGKQMTKTFLICNTGSHAAILGLKWLDAHNPEIDWNTRTLTFPHAAPEHVTIAEEEEADKNPLEGVPSKYHRYAKVFGEEEFNKLPPHRHYNIGIELTEEGPLNSPLYSMTDAESATLKDWLRDKLKAGKIRPSKSSISSPVMFVPKKDGSRQLVVDYRRLNNRTKKNVYPLPRPDDLMAQLRGAKIFTKLDLRWGYNNVRVKEGDKWKTAFRTKYGLYKSLVMTFGLTNAPAAFQHFMNKLFKDLLDVCVIIYLDDILIYSKDDASHTQHVHEVLKRLMENQLLS
ncbi:Retrotransposon gag protein [Rhizoctonia solani]|uniref:Retrotransposon gag protein n=1 Tax=Rhizoctonia solani TaxID=456999 RepID=A0A8H7IA65_9AGAM|nr:Retrotransposon gag protein [Rhizoctonia solani]